MVIRYMRQRMRRLLRVTARISRVVVYGFDLLLWSKLFANRRLPAVLEFTHTLLETKSIRTLPPTLTVSAPGGAKSYWSRGFAGVNAGLFLNLNHSGALSKSRYAQPAPSFPGIYLWDSAFIAQIWKWWDAEVARDVLNAVVERRQGDRLQHFVADFVGSNYTQPPLLAWSLVQLQNVVEPTRFESWLHMFYLPLRAYHHWLFANRQLPNGLFAWAHPYESGVENAPRFSSRDEHCLDDTNRLAAPDFCAYMVLKCEALAAMAWQLDRPAEAADYQRQAGALRDAVNGYLWDEAEGLYFDRNVDSGEWIRSRTIASLLPLWAGIPDSQQAERLRHHILDPRAFNTVIPLPSVALSDAAFEKDMWRGPVWLNTAFAVIAGLRRYGYHDAAADLAFRLCDGVYRTFEHTGRFHEFYDPDSHHANDLHRKRGNRWKRLTLGARPVTEFVGWSGLVNTLIIDVLFGLVRSPAGFVIRPRFPPRAEGLRFELDLPAADLSIELDVLPTGRACGIGQGKGYVCQFEVAFGEQVVLQPEGECA